MRFPCQCLSQVEEARGRKGGWLELPHLRGLRAEKGCGRLFILSPSILETEIRLAPAVGQSEPRGVGGKRPRGWAGRVKDPPRRRPCQQRPGERGSAPIPGCTAPRPLPFPCPAPPDPGPLPAGSGRRGRGGGGGFSGRVCLTHWGASPWRHLREEKQRRREPARQQVGGRTDWRQSRRTDRQTDSGAARRPESPQVQPWAGARSCGWVGKRGASRGPGPQRAQAGVADRRRLGRVGPSPPLAEGGRPAPLCVQTPLPSRPRGAGLLVRAPASAAPAAEGSALDCRGGGLLAPAPAAVLSRPLSSPLSVLRLHSPDAWLSAGPLFSVFVSPRPEAGEGAHCPEGAQRAGKRVRAANPARARVPGARASPGPSGAGSREAPPAALAPGRGSRAALFGARPPASQAQPTRPFPSPGLRAPDRRSFVRSGWAAPPATLCQGVGFWDLN